MDRGLPGGAPPSRSPLALDSPGASMIEHLKARAVRGVAWTGASQMASNVVQLATVVVLARLLSPGDFGVFGIAAVLLGLPTAVVDMGLGAALLQREETSQRELSTYFWWVLVAAGVLAGLSIAASGALASFFQVPILAGVIVVASFRLVVDALQMVQRVVLRRRLDFESMAVAEIVAVTASGVTAIGLAGLGWGVWSLAWASLLRGGIEGGLLWGLSAWRPTRQFSGRELRGLLPFGRNVMGKSVVGYLSSNVDGLVIAKLLTASDLGVYRFAYTLAMFPQERLAPTVTRVAFPVLSRVQHDDARLRHGYLQGVKYLALISFPLLVGLVVVARDAVAVVFGARWLAAVLPLQLFCGLGLLYSVSTLMTSVFLAKGRPEIEFRGNAVLLGVMVVAVLLGVRFGATGVAAAVTLAGALGVCALLGFLNRLIRLRWREYGPALRPAVTACTAMALALALLRAADTAGYLGSDLASLIAMVAVGTGVYVGALLVMERPLVSELFDLYRMTRGPSEREVHAHAGVLTSCAIRSDPS